MNMQHLGIELMRDEGVRFRKYLDTKKIWTCGVGHNCEAAPLPADWTFPLTKAQVLFLLDGDIASKVAGLSARLPAWKNLDDVRQRVCVNVAFNCGVNGFFGFKNMVAAINRSDWKRARLELLDSDAARDAPTRYARLASMLITGMAPAAAKRSSALA